MNGKTTPLDLIGRIQQPRKPFDDVWDLWTRKCDKGHARAAYLRAVKKIGHVELVEAVKKYMLTRRGRDDRFTPHLATWLNGERWLDEPENGGENGDSAGNGSGPHPAAADRQGGDSILAAYRAITNRRRRE